VPFDRYSTNIKEYCARHLIEIPLAFWRHGPSRYALIHLDTDPGRIVASTWANQNRVIEYLKRAEAGIPHRILDLEDLHEVHYAGGTKLTRGAQPVPVIELENHP
jgi:hypothetical protein